MDNKNNTPAPDPVLSPRAVQAHAPTMQPSLDALVRYGRGLMDASQGAKDLFESHFSGRIEVDNLKPSMDEEFKVISSVWMTVPMNTSADPSADPSISVTLISGTQSTQKWAVKFCGVTIAEKKLSDRSAQAKLPEDQVRPPVDGEWIFSRLCMEKFIMTEALEGSAGLIIIQNVIGAAAQKAEQLLEETKQPEYVQKAAAVRNARWAGAFAKPPETPIGTDYDPKKAVDVSALLGRLSKASRIAKP